MFPCLSSQSSRRAPSVACAEVPMIELFRLAKFGDSAKNGALVDMLLAVNAAATFKARRPGSCAFMAAEPLLFRSRPGRTHQPVRTKLAEPFCPEVVPDTVTTWEPLAPAVPAPGIIPVQEKVPSTWLPPVQTVTLLEAARPVA